MKNSLPLPAPQEGDWLSAAGETHRGLRKRINQDAIAVWGPGVPLVERTGGGYVFAAIDGLGGEPGGEVAAQTIKGSVGCGGPD